VDLIDNRALDDVLEAPTKVCKIDSIHRRAHADQGGKEVDLLFGVLFFEAIDQVEFGADGPLGTGWSLFDRLDDLARRA